MKHNPVYTREKVSCHLTEAFHVLYIVKLYDKRENEFKGFCWNNDHLLLGQEY